MRQQDRGEIGCRQVSLEPVIGALLSINSLLDGRKLRLVNLPRPVRKVLDLTRLTGFLPISETELDAIEEIDGTANRAKPQPA